MLQTIRNNFSYVVGRAEIEPVTTAKKDTPCKLIILNLVTYCGTRHPARITMQDSAALSPTPAGCPAR
jgi:hypothetical protein